MGKHSSTPKPNPMTMLPTYTAPTAVPYPTFSELQGMSPAPFTPGQTVSQMIGADKRLNGTGLNLIGNPLLNPDTSISKYEQAFIDNQLNPGINAEKSNLALQGRDTSTFGGAELGQMEAQGRYQAGQYGLGLWEQNLNNLLNERNNLFGNEGQLAQNYNTMNQQNNQYLTGLYNSNIGNQNQFNLASAGMKNNFGLGLYGEYQNAADRAYQMQLQQQMAQGAGLAALGTGGLSLLGGGIGKLFGGGGGGGGGLFGSLGQSGGGGYSPYSGGYGMGDYNLGGGYGGTPFGANTFGPSYIDMNL